jgi:hypothetical protein
MIISGIIGLFLVPGALAYRQFTVAWKSTLAILGVFAANVAAHATASLLHL